MTPATGSVETLTVEQQAALGSGADFWTTKAIGSVPSVRMADGPHGLRAQDLSEGTAPLGVGPSIAATCFPPAVALGQSWDPEPARRVGQAIAIEARAAGVHVVLGPGVNLKRDPRCGRNFEYYSEDPLLSGVLAAGWVDGLQGQGIGASLKHFAANNTETDRFRSSSDVDPRPLREIYLRAFHRVIRDARPWTVMCSYNAINGVLASRNAWLLTDLLRGEWGFDGVVVSDWGAVDDRVAAVRAGLDLQMPGDGGVNDQDVVAAVAEGVLAADEVARTAARVAGLAAKAAASAGADASWAVEGHHALAREVAGRCAVLLKNEDGLLPLIPGGSIAVVGEFATRPRYQGGGSSHVNATRVDSPLDELTALAGAGTVSFTRGFTTDGTGDADALLTEAVAAARAADTAVVFLGLADAQESEGFDRKDIELPAGQVELLRAIHRVQPRTAVVLVHGGVLRLAPVVGHAGAILDAALLGQAAGGAIADVLFGVVNPSGRLTETVPERIEDTPAFLNFPGEYSHVRYGEGLFPGYRWYDARRMSVTFPFGHGLSYTTFRYSGLELAENTEGLAVRVRVANTGDRPGREIVQVYIGLESSTTVRAVQELKGFTAVDLDAGEEREVTVPIARADLAYWHPILSRWVVEGGDYTVRVGASSRDLRLSGTVAVTGDPVRLPLSLDSTVAEVLADPAASVAFGELVAGSMGELEMTADNDMGVDMLSMVGSMPIGRIVSLLGGAITRDQLRVALDKANKLDLRSH